MTRPTTWPNFGMTRPKFERGSLFCHLPSARVDYLFLLQQKPADQFSYRTTMSTDNKRRATDSPAASSQPRRLRAKVHRRAGSGTSHGSGQPYTPTLHGIPETGAPGLVQQHYFFEDSSFIDYTYDTDNSAFVHDVNDDSSVHSLDGTSVLGEDAADEVVKKFCNKSNLPWNDQCIEWQICHDEKTGVEALVADAVAKIRQDPRKSVIATMGLEAIRNGVIITQTNEARWTNNAGAYSAKAKEIFAKEAELKPAMDESYQKLKEANDNYHHLQSKVHTLEESRRNFEEHCRKYERRARIANVMVGVMRTFTAESADLKVSVCVRWLPPVGQSADHNCNSQACLPLLLALPE